MIEICWEAGAPPPDLPEGPLRDALECFLAELGRPDGGLSVLMAGDSELRVLNQRFRGQDRPTDVLSWSYDDAAADPALLGELALSVDRAREQAAENGWELGTEVLRLMAHGCAHLAGYRHDSPEAEREMMAVEIRMLTRAGLPALYPAGPQSGAGEAG